MIEGLPGKHYAMPGGDYLGFFAGYIDEAGKEHQPNIPEGAVECDPPAGWPEPVEIEA